MRTIKFRAWNGIKYRHNVSIDNGHPVRDGYQWFNPGNDVYSAIPEQYTGLNDKNGKEIYEGDVVESSRYASNDLFRSVVKDIRELPRLMFGSELNYNEVIGNIHQNQELI